MSSQDKRSRTAKDRYQEQLDRIDWQLRTIRQWHLAQSSRDPVVDWPTWIDVEEAQRIIGHLALAIGRARPAMPGVARTVKS